MLKIIDKTNNNKDRNWKVGTLIKTGRCLHMVIKSKNGYMLVNLTDADSSREYPSLNEIQEVLAFNEDVIVDGELIIKNKVGD